MQYYGLCNDISTEQGFYPSGRHFIGPADEAAGNEMQARVNGAMASLSAVEQLICREWAAARSGDHAIAKLAEHIGVTRQTVYNYLASALRKLKGELGVAS